MSMMEDLRAAMARCGRTRYRIAREAGIDESILSRFANGKTVLEFATAARLADYLGLEIVLRPKRGRGARKGGVTHG